MSTVNIGVDEALIGIRELQQAHQGDCGIDRVGNFIASE